MGLKMADYRYVEKENWDPVVMLRVDYTCISSSCDMPSCTVGLQLLCVQLNSVGHIPFILLKRGMQWVSGRPPLPCNSFLLPSPCPPWDPVGTNVLAQWVEKESQGSEA